MSFLIFIKGFAVSFGLIVAIGAQNAFVLKQGIKKQYVFPIVLTCSLIDSILIFLGVSGVGKAVANSNLFLWGVTVFGILFLAAYGLMASKNVFKSESLHVKESKEIASLKKAMVILLGLTLLNPHVWLDTFLLIGSIGGQYQTLEQKSFILGACSASFIWFFGLGYGSRVLAPLFEKPVTWKILDAFIAFVMFSIAFALIVSLQDMKSPF